MNGGVGRNSGSSSHSTRSSSPSRRSRSSHSDASLPASPSSPDGSTTLHTSLKERKGGSGSGLRLDVRGTRMCRAGRVAFRYRHSLPPLHQRTARVLPQRGELENEYGYPRSGSSNHSSYSPLFPMPWLRSSLPSSIPTNTCCRHASCLPHLLLLLLDLSIVVRRSVSGRSAGSN